MRPNTNTWAIKTHLHTTWHIHKQILLWLHFLAITDLTGNRFLNYHELHRSSFLPLNHHVFHLVCPMKEVGVAQPTRGSMGVSTCLHRHTHKHTLCCLPAVVSNIDFCLPACFCWQQHISITPASFTDTPSAHIHSHHHGNHITGPIQHDTIHGHLGWMWW